MPPRKTSTTPASPRSKLPSTPTSPVAPNGGLPSPQPLKRLRSERCVALEPVTVQVDVPTRFLLSRGSTTRVQCPSGGGGGGQSNREETPTTAQVKAQLHTLDATFSATVHLATTTVVDVHAAARALAHHERQVKTLSSSSPSSSSSSSSSTSGEGLVSGVVASRNAVQRYYALQTARQMMPPCGADVLRAPSSYLAAAALFLSTPEGQAAAIGDRPHALGTLIAVPSLQDASALVAAWSRTVGSDERARLHWACRELLLAET